MAKNHSNLINQFFRYFVFFLLLSCQFPSSFSQSIKGVISDSGKLNKYIFLYETIGNHNYKIDSSLVNDSGIFFFPYKKYPAGYYMLVLNDSNRADVILNSSEKEIEINFKQPQLQDGVRIISSVENKLLWEYKYISKAIYGELKNIYIRKSYIPLPPQNSADSAQLKQLQHLEDSLNDYKLQQLKKICTQNPNTYFAKSAKAALRKKYDSKEEEKKHFFETVDFADASLIRSVIFPTNMMDYLQKFTEYNEVGFKSSVDTILQLAKVNPEVYEFCLNYLLELFDRVGPDMIFQYLTEKYLIGEGCSELNVSETFKNKAEAYRLLLPGNKAPDIILKDVSGVEKRISEIAVKNKITVLFFWSSHCNFCHKAIPELIELYSKYNSKGVEIIGISLDENKSEWEKYVYNSQLKWVNLSDLRGWKSLVVEKFKIHKTPSFYLLDAQMFILSKPATAEDLKVELEKR